MHDVSDVQFGAPGEESLEAFEAIEDDTDTDDLEVAEEKELTV